MEREAEKSREKLREYKISRYLKPLKSTSCPRVACSSDNSGKVAKKRHPREETESVQVEFPEGSSSYDKTEHMNVAKERPHRAVPASVCTPEPKLKPHLIIKGRKRGRNLDFERVVESPAKKNILDGKAEDVDFNLIHTCLKNATPPDDVDILNLGSGHSGGQSDNC